ncbi:MAG: nocR [Devosia sp.]|nr:nocR [Devosia sp.]
MDKVGIELSLLSKFVLACQFPRLAHAAAQLAQTPSALSIALHGLEDRLGLKLFIRRGGGLDLLPAAFWLFRSSAQLLYLEQHARQTHHHLSKTRVRLTIEVDLSFAIGRVSKALLRTGQDLIASHPEILLDWRFAGLAQDDFGEPTGLAAPELLPAEVAQIRILYRSAKAGASSSMPLYDDPWIVVGSQGSSVAQTFSHDPLTLLRMRSEVIAAMTDFAAARGFIRQLQFRDEDPSQLAPLLLENPQMRLLMPSNLLPTRLGLARHESAPFEPRFVSTLYGEVSGAAAQHGAVFLDRLRHNLADEQSVIFTPQLTARQVHYFNLAAHAGSISAAARIANAAQSSVSKHISQMDTVMGTPLLSRREDGASLTELGRSVRPFMAGIEERQDWIIRKAHDIAAHSQARVTIGTLPSSGHDSALTEKIAQVVTKIHARHPDWQLHVVEHSNTVLHERVRHGDLNLAVVGMVNAQVARIGLGPSEPLSVIGNPAIDFGGRKVLGLQDVCALPLVLGRLHLSIHQSFVEAARERSLRLKTAVEVGSLALAIAMVRQAPLCTVLPASSVRRDIEAGNLVAVPIREGELSGSLSVIFSAERELSEAERIIVQEFVRVFRPGRERQGEERRLEA